MIEIEKLEKKEVLTYQELENIFMGYLNDKLSEKEMTKVLNLICKNGLTDNEIYDLTDIFIKSGEEYPKNSSFIDKHSTGGVSDTTTLIILPILASLNVKVTKMSGRSLGHTGGTIDKLESIGVKTNLSKKEFYNTLEKHNMVISAQTDNLCPLDKKVYALRDKTGTVKSLPLIATSIMSKKIAAGAGKILIDIKVGKGALIENKKEAETLANLMIKIGENYSREVVCVLSRMDNPLGDNIGNKLEVLEALEILNNEKENDLKKLSLELASIMYSMSKNTSIASGSAKTKNAIETGKAYNVLKNYIKDLKGKDIEIKDKEVNIISNKSGYIKSIDSEMLGNISRDITGIKILKRVTNKVKKGDVIAKAYGKSVNIEDIYNSFVISKIKPKHKNIIIKIVK